MSALVHRRRRRQGAALICGSQLFAMIDPGAPDLAVTVARGVAPGPPVWAAMG